MNYGKCRLSSLAFFLFGHQSFNITAVPVMARASNEPSLYIGTGSGDEKDESESRFFEITQ